MGAVPSVDPVIPVGRIPVGREPPDPSQAIPVGREPPDPSQATDIKSLVNASLDFAHKRHNSSVTEESYPHVHGYPNRGIEELRSNPIQRQAHRPESLRSDQWMFSDKSGASTRPGRIGPDHAPSRFDIRSGNGRGVLSSLSCEDALGLGHGAIPGTQPVYPYTARMETFHADSEQPFSQDRIGRQIIGDGMEERRRWEIGSILEVYSTKTGCWNVACVTDIQHRAEGEVLNVQFLGKDGQLKEKSLHRHDQHLMPLNTHTNDQAPPGFSKHPSQSRPGQIVFYDSIACQKYASADLAWQVHFERMFNSPVDGMETIYSVVPNQFSAESVSGHRGRPDHGFEAMQALNVVIVDSNLQPRGQAGNSQMDTYINMEEPMEAMNPQEDPENAGKIALPQFTDARATSQDMYLRRLGSTGAAGPLAVKNVQQHAQVGPLGLPQRGPVPQGRPGAGNHLQTWNEDPFSQWRA